MAKEIEINLEEENNVSMEVKDTGNVEIGMESDFGGTTDYNKLKNKPSINGVTLEGNKTLEELGIINYDDTEIKENITEIEKENIYQNKRLEYLEKNQIQAEVKGEDTLTVTDGAFAYANILKETEIEVEGKKKKAYLVGLPQGISKQEQREGYNLFDAINSYPETHTKTGITFTKNSDGTFNAHGTATSDTSIGLATGIMGYLVAGEECSLYSNIPYNNNTFNLSLTYGGEGMTNKYILANSSKILDDITQWATLNLYIPNGQTINVDNVKVMICKGAYDSSKPFEQYGATPSIEIPSEIENVRAYNLFDKNNVINDKYIDVTGNENINDPWVITDYIEVNQFYKYTYYGISTVGVSPRSAFYDSNKTFISSFKQAIGINVINPPENAKYVRFSINKGASNDLNTFIFYKGIEDKPYAPYGAINIKLENENLISDNINDWEEGHYNGFTGFPEFYASRIRLIQLVKVEPNTTYYCNTYNKLYGFVIREYDYNRNFINNTGGVSKGIITTNSNTKYLSIALYKNTAPETTSKELFNLVENGTIKPFICLNSESNKEYFSRQEQNYNLHIKDLELNGIGDIRDSFVVEIDNSYSYKKVKKLYLKKYYDKTILKDLSWIIENTFQSTSSKRYVSPSLNTTVKRPIANNKTSGILCNIEKEKVADLNYQRNNSIAIDTSGRICFFDKSLENETDTTALIQKLTDTNAYLIYPLENPELVDLTETYPELVQDIENIINNMFTYEEVTHIDTPIGYLELTYTKSNKLIIKNIEKNYDDRISALEQAILAIGGQNV